MSNLLAAVPGATRIRENASSAGQQLPEQGSLFLQQPALFFQQRGLLSVQVFQDHSQIPVLRQQPGFFRLKPAAATQGDQRRTVQAQSPERERC